MFIISTSTISLRKHFFKLCLKLFLKKYFIHTYWWVWHVQFFDHTIVCYAVQSWTFGNTRSYFHSEEREYLAMICTWGSCRFSVKHSTNAIFHCRKRIIIFVILCICFWKYYILVFLIIWSEYLMEIDLYIVFWFTLVSWWNVTQFNCLLIN